MKSKFNIKKTIGMIGLFAAGAAALMVFSCASGPKDLMGQKIISYKGAELGLQIPDWVKKSQSISRLMQMPEYQDYICFVATVRSQNLDFAETWAQEFDATQQMGRYFQTGVANLMNARATGTSDSVGGGTAAKTVANNAAAEAAMQRQISNYLNTSTVADFSTARREGDFWTYVRTYDPDNRSKHWDMYVAYVLYIIPKDKAEQIASWYLDNLAKRQDDLGALATGLKAEVTAHHLSLINEYDKANAQAEEKKLKSEVQANAAQ